MRKRVLFGLCLSAFALLGFAGCRSDAKMKAYFAEDEFIFSVNEEVNFYDYIETKGLKKEDLSFVSSNEEVLAFTEDGFLAKSSGQSYILAKYKTNTLASVKVVVKYKFASPKNFVLNQEDGVLSWDSSYTVIEGERVYAEQYEISYKDITDGNHEKIFEQEISNENRFTIENIGSYLVKVRAISTSKYIDDSSMSNEYTAIYNAMGLIENLTLSYEDGYNGQATLAWDDKENGIYDIYVNDTKIFSEIDQNSFNYSFAPFADLAEVKIEIDAKDSTGEKANTKTKFYVTKLETPRVEYCYQNKNGFISWNNVSDLGYTVLSQNNTEGAEGNCEFEILHDFPAGINNVNVVANGGMLYGHYYASSNLSSTLKVVKLDTPVVNITFDGSVAKFIFEENEYIKNYRIQVAGRNVLVDTSQSLEYEIDLGGDNFSLVEGKYTFNITSLPSFYNDDTAVPFDFENGQAIYAINSDDYVYDFYVLGEIGEVNHSFDAQGKSVLTFGEIENATNYQVFINNDEYDDFETSLNDGIRTIIIENLKSFAPVENRYDIKIVARRLQEDFEKSTVSISTKTLTILSPVTQGEYENGSFAWNDEQDLGRYSYYINESNSDFSQVGVLTASLVTDEKQIDEVLNYGYYIVKVVTLSKDNNSYLDSDFYDEENILKENLIVSEQIATPEVVFVNDNGVYKLQITTVSFGGLYSVKVDNIDDGNISVVTNQPEVIYSLQNNNLSTAKRYKIQIVASSGTNDETLHTPSLPKTLYVTRLPQASIVVTDVVESDTSHIDVKTKELLSATTDSEDAVRVDIKLGGTVVSENNVVNLIGYTNNFNLSVVTVAKANEGDEYYLDSIPKVVNFQRASFPTSINYTNGDITFVNNNQVEEFYLAIEAVTANGNCTIGYFLNSDGYSLQGDTYTIDFEDLLSSITDVNFQSFLSHATQIKIKIASYVNSYDPNSAYTISSLFGSTVGGQDTLIVEKLDAPAISFTNSSQKISWEALATGTSYDIYVNDVRRVADYGSTSITLDNLGVSESELLSEINVYIKAKNSHYIASDFSNEIFIKKLAKIESISMSSTWTVTSYIPQDSLHVSDVNINGFTSSSSKVNYQEGATSFSFVPSDFTQAVSIKLIAKNDCSHYYLDSEETNINFINIGYGGTLFVLSAENGNIEYDNLYNKLNCNMDHDPIVYTMYVNDDELHPDNWYNFVLEPGEFSFSLQEIESRISEYTKLNTGLISIKVTALVGEYTTSILSDAVCCYGGRESQSATTQKLESISNTTLKIEESGATEWDKKSGAYAVLSWEDLWSTLGNVNFEVKIGDENPFTVWKDLTLTNYSCTLDEGNYKLTLKKNILPSTSNQISITVKYTNCINSEVCQTTINRCDINHIVASISDEGLLTIASAEGYESYYQNYDYVVKVSIGDITNAERLVSAGGTLDLMQDGLLGGKAGNYTVKILPYHKDNAYLPANNSIEINGTKIQGIETVNIDENGRLVVKLYSGAPENLTWMIRIKNDENGIKTFNPVFNPYDEKFYFPVIDVIDVLDIESFDSYDIQISVKATGSVRCDWKDLTFAYAQENNGEVAVVKTANYDSYIKFDGSGATSFRIELIVSQSEKQEIYVSANEVAGYWINDDFFTEQASGSTHCYAISIEDLLKDYEYGTFTLKVSRFDQSDGNKQYNTYEFVVTKLNAPSEILIENNFVSWQWENESNNFATPTGYFVELTNIVTNVVTKIKTYANSLDLRTAGLFVNNRYNVSIIAFSNYVDLNENAIVTNSNNSVEQPTQRYASVDDIGLVYKEGKIMFNSTNLFATELFTNMIRVKNNDLSVSEFINSTNYAPFYTSIENFKKAAVKLKFTAPGNSESYTVVAAVFNLIPDDDKLTEFYNYSKTLSSQNPDNKTLQVFAKLLLDSSHGIGDGKLLIDDLQSPERNNADNVIPAGTYNLTIYRCNDFYTDPNILNTNYIESEESSSSSVTLKASPTATLSYQNGKYLLTLGINDNSITKYKMVIREDNSTKNPNYKFTNIIPLEYVVEHITGNNWQLSIFKKDMQTGEIQEEIVISDVVTYSSQSNSLIIDLTKLREKTEETAEAETTLISMNVDYKLDVFGYFGDINGRINGKSATVYVHYLDLDISQCLSIDSGNIVINGGNNQRVFVQYTGQTESGSFVLDIDVNGAKINEGLPVNGGIYNIVLSLMGSIEGNRVKVESETYAILNAYKLYNPILSIADGNLEIHNNNNNTKTPSQYEFSINETYWENISYLTGQASLIIPDSRYYSAGTFYAYAQGNTINNVNFTREVNSVAGISAKYRINVGGEIILSSEITSLNAKMINALHSVEIENGQIVWQDQTVEDNFKDSSAKVIYEVKIEYYDSTNNFLSEDVLYIENNILATEYISENENYQNYKVSITRIPATQSESETDIQTLEGNYFLLSNSTTNTIYIVDGGDYYALRSDKVTFHDGEFLTRTGSPTAIGNGTFEGKIKFNVKSHNIEQFNTENIAIFYEKDAERKQIFGEYQIQINNGDYDVTFTPYNNQIDNNIDPFTLKIYINKPNSLYSKPLVLNNVYKLRPVKGDDLEFSLDGTNTLIDFTNFYNNYMIQDSNNMYEVIVIVEKDDETTEKINTRMYDVNEEIVPGEYEQLLVENNWKKLIIQVVDIQKSNASPFRLLLNSDLVEFVINKTSDENLNIDWEEDDEKFVWSTGDDETNYQFLYTLVVNENVTESEYTQNFYYMPKQMGEIQSFSLFARNASIKENFEIVSQANLNNFMSFFVFRQVDPAVEEFNTSERYYNFESEQPVLLTELTGFEGGQTYYVCTRATEYDSNANYYVVKYTLYTFSAEVNYNNGESGISSNLFSDGNGTELNPYLIENVEQFLNIAKRNEEGSKFYFKLIDNIEVNLSDLIVEKNALYLNIFDTFYGELDGNAHTLTINYGDTLYDFEGYCSTISGFGSVNFNKYAALFKQLDANAKVKNLNINLNSFSFTNVNVLYSGITLYNYGEIENVNISSINMPSSFVGSGNTFIFMSGIASINRNGGKISGCRDNSSWSYTAPQSGQNVNLKFGYCSVCAYNLLNSTINNCYNTGNKSISTRRAGDIVCITGISIVNSGNISLCGNNGNFTAGSSVNLYAYLAGVVLNNSSVLQYCFNNGSLAKNGSSVTLYAGGIAYSISGGRINALVDTSDTNIVSQCATSPSYAGNSYAKVHENANVTVYDLDRFGVDHASGYIQVNNYRLQLSMLNGKYVASITEN